MVAFPFRDRGLKLSFVSDDESRIESSIEIVQLHNVGHAHQGDSIPWGRRMM